MHLFCFLVFNCHYRCSQLPGKDLSLKWPVMFRVGSWTLHIHSAIQSWYCCCCCYCFWVLCAWPVFCACSRLWGFCLIFFGFTFFEMAFGWSGGVRPEMSNNWRSGISAYRLPLLSWLRGVICSNVSHWMAADYVHSSVCLSVCLCMFMCPRMTYTVSSGTLNPTQLIMCNQDVVVKRS